jgi:hypothetical protein
MLGTLPTVYGAMRMALLPPLVSGGVRLGKPWKGSLDFLTELSSVDLFSLTL